VNNRDELTGGQVGGGVEVGVGWRDSKMSSFMK